MSALLRRVILIYSKYSQNDTFKAQCSLKKKERKSDTLHCVSKILLFSWAHLTWQMQLITSLDKKLMPEDYFFVKWCCWLEMWFCGNFPSSLSWYMILLHTRLVLPLSWADIMTHRSSITLNELWSSSATGRSHSKYLSLIHVVCAIM